MGAGGMLVHLGSECDKRWHRQDVCFCPLRRQTSPEDPAGATAAAAARRLEEQDPTAADIATAGGRVRFAGRETMRSERLPFTSTVQKAALLVILSVGVVGGAAAIDDPYVFATIDPPGATWAEAYGINAVGDIVG